MLRAYLCPSSGFFWPAREGFGFGFRTSDLLLASFHVGDDAIRMRCEGVERGEKGEWNSSASQTRDFHDFCQQIRFSVLFHYCAALRNTDARARLHNGFSPHSQRRETSVACDTHAAIRFRGSLTPLSCVDDIRLPKSMYYVPNCCACVCANKTRAPHLGARIPLNQPPGSL